MKIVYIAHPIGGKVEENLKDLYRIIKSINFTYDDVVPFAPYIADVLSLNDSNPSERARGFQNNTAILKSGIVNELWLTGDRISMGMAYEMELAKENGIKIVDLIGQI